ncbi:YbjQ family protein [Spongiivirga citrea]|uniref:Heavy metal-binding domain-containing protein n=1 Tax=Spongiivirga citrea TaxID=1481457 RepID=A0A6M0CZ13_9FLAO|nr:heavy metal-binding domain-containing protein [Spongiivirga citrea]NER19010.1 heavy metal-binding domain-containing protein [Spongiivirga citrea]
MILTTTNSIDGKTISNYLGVVTGTTYVVNYGTKGMSFKDMFNSSKYYANYENGLEEAKEEAFQKLRDNANNQAADAVVGISFDIEMMGANGVTMVSIVGTAVKFA